MPARPPKAHPDAKTPRTDNKSRRATMVLMFSACMMASKVGSSPPEASCVPRLIFPDFAGFRAFSALLPPRPEHKTHSPVHKTHNTGALSSQKLALPTRHDL